MSPTHLQVKKRPGTNQFYDEVLATGVLPLRMLLIPAGSFWMGSPSGELERQDDEGPQHEVKVPQFFMAKYPVTQAQWRAVANLPQVERELDPKPSNFTGDLRPVEQVSWHDAIEFCGRLTNNTNRQYRLPSEAEWEYACRAGTTTPFHFGDITTTDVANYNGTYTYADGPKGENRDGTTPIDYFGIANAFGLSDMHGNVWEWCQDYWHNSYDGAPTDGSAWVEGGDSSRRVLRGGAWYDIPGFCRSAYRYDFEPEYRYNFIGFRVVCSAPRPVLSPGEGT